MRFDSRLVLLAVLAAGVIALGWTWLAGEDPQEAAPATTNTSPASTRAADEEQDAAAVAEEQDTVAVTTATTVPATTFPTTTTAAPTTTTTTFPTPEVLGEVHPRLVDIDGWLQSQVETLEELRGKVVVVEFWTFGCYNCKNRIPYTQEMYAEYRDQGLEIVGIHSPEFKYEEDVDNIKKALIDLGVTWPVVLDTRRRTFWEWQAGGTAYWPRTYVLDREGRVRFDHIGEGKYRELEQTVAFLLSEKM